MVAARAVAARLVARLVGDLEGGRVTWGLDCGGGGLAAAEEEERRAEGEKVAAMGKFVRWVKLCCFLWNYVYFPYPALTNHTMPPHLLKFCGWYSFINITRENIIRSTRVFKIN